MEYMWENAGSSFAEGNIQVGNFVEYKTREVDLIQSMQDLLS